MSMFSFIIPVYNCEQYLKNCVSSLIKMELENYEVILIDDGSSDRSGFICEELVKEYAKVCCVHQENQGVSSARNYGLKIAKGDYVIFLDADDSIETVRLSHILHFLDSNHQVDLVLYGISFDYYYHGKCYRRDEVFYPLSGNMSRSQWLGAMEALYEANALSPIWNKVFRRDILERNHLTFNPKMFLYEDLEFSLRYMACCDVIYNCPECIYHYRQSEDEGNAGRRLKRIEHLPELIGQIEEVLDHLIEVQHAEERKKQIKSILMSLYLVLAREKISVSNAKETLQICDDFSEWVKSSELEIPEGNQIFVEQLLKRKVYMFLGKKYYTLFRHRIAVLVKNTKWYQKRRFRNVTEA